MSLQQVDQWFGTRIFIPPVIWLCHLTRQSQYAVSRMFWFFAALAGLYRADTPFSLMLWGGTSVVMLFTATQWADRPATSLMFVRLLGLAFLALAILRLIVAGEWSQIDMWFLILLAEYAATIRTLPPLEGANATSLRKTSSK